MRPHHLFFLVLAPVWLIGRLDRAALRPWAAPAFAAALVLLCLAAAVALPIETRRDAADCDACEEFQPVETYARALRAAGFARGTILALSRRQDFPTAALATHFPDARLVAADYTVYAPPPGAVPGDCLIVWSGAADWPEGWGPGGAGARARAAAAGGGGDRAGDRAAAPLRAADAGDALRAGEGRARRLPLRRAADGSCYGRAWTISRSGSSSTWTARGTSRATSRRSRRSTRIPGMQELKALGRERGGVAPGRSLLDVGCGFGLETLRLAAAAGPGATVAGIDKSADFIADAAARATAAGLAIDFRVGDATALPWADASFDAVRAERLLIYLADWQAAVREMRRVAKPGAGLAFIEPDFSTTTVNLPDRSAVRRALAHEADTAVVESWLPGALLGCSRTSGSAASRWRPGSRSSRRTSARPTSRRSGGTPPRPGRSSAAELDAWLAGIADLHARGRLFGTVGYFLFTARA